jgi:hypothetical protein
VLREIGSERSDVGRESLNGGEDVGVAGLSHALSVRGVVTCATGFSRTRQGRPAQCLPSRPQCVPTEPRNDEGPETC